MTAAALVLPGLAPGRIGVAAYLGERRARYAQALRATGADLCLLASDAGVQHATGIRLYSMAIIPERPVVALVDPADTSVVVWEWEHDQLAAERPGLRLVGFPEWGVDPWDAVAAEAARLAPGGTILLEWTTPAPAVPALERAGLRVTVDAGLALLGVRSPKDPAEIAWFERASRLADEAIAAVAAEGVMGRTERGLADAIADRFLTCVGGEAEAAGIVSGPASNRENHHLGSGRRLTGGAVRLGLKARVDGYWMLLTRMAWASDDSSGPPSDVASDYAAYMAAHEAGWRALVPGAEAGAINALVRATLEAGGLRLRSPKVGHATGLSFRELPVLRADDHSPIAPGTVLAYDFAIVADATRSGTFLHVEDRVLVTPSGPVRLSDAIDTGRMTPLRL